MKTTREIEEAKNKKKQNSSLVGKKQSDLKIDSKDTSHIMSILTNIYTSSATAVLREYVSNAYDAMVKAGNLGSRPIEVVLHEDKSFKPRAGGEAYAGGHYISVRDFGNGMTESDLFDVYSLYGASTKKEETNSIGGFGIGAKSALSLTKYFEIDSYVNGHLIEACVLMNEITNLATLYIQNEVSTKEPNGVEIRVPVSEKALEEISGSIFSLFCAWDKNTIRVNGKVPDGTGILNNKYYPKVYNGDNVLAWLIPRNSEKKFLNSLNVDSPYTNRINDGINDNVDLFDSLLFPEILIGGIPYKRPKFFQIERYFFNSEKSQVKKAITNITRNFHTNIILNIPIGVVKLTPNREHIQDSEENNAIIGGLYQKVVDELADVYEAFIQSMTKAEAIKFSSDNFMAMYPKLFTHSDSRNSISDVVSGIISKNDFSIKWRGQDIPLQGLYSDLLTDKSVRIFTGNSKDLTPVLSPATKYNFIAYSAQLKITNASFQRYTMSMSKMDKPNIFVIYGKNKSKTSNPFKSNFRQGINEFFDTSANKYLQKSEYVWFETENENDIQNLKETFRYTMHINEMTEYAKKYRKVLADARKKIVVEDRIYPIVRLAGSFDNNIEMITKTDLENLKGETFIVGTDIKATDLINEPQELHSTIFRQLSTLLPNSVLILVPMGRKPSVIQKINPKAILLQDKLEEEFKFNGSKKQFYYALAIMKAIFTNAFYWNRNANVLEIAKVVEDEKLHSIFNSTLTNKDEILFEIATYSTYVSGIKFFQNNTQINVKEYFSEKDEYKLMQKIIKASQILTDKSSSNFKIEGTLATIFETVDMLTQLPKFKL